MSLVDDVDDSKATSIWVGDDHDVAHVGVLLNLWMIPCIDVVAALSVAVARLPAVAAFIRAGAVIGPCGGRA